MSGKVFLVGAGVMGIDHLTVKAYRLISEADVILYDRLIEKSVLEIAKPGAQLIYVGKEPGEGPKKQHEITDLAIEFAKQGKTVIRLKSGDPFIFGRGGEEMVSIREAGIEVEAVPGLTSAIAIPTIVGIPLTMRDLSSSVVILTGHLAQPNEEQYFKTHAKFPGTLVLLMSLTNLSRIAGYLIDGGMDLEKPVSVITRINDHKLRKEFYRLAEIKTRMDCRDGPGIVIIGDVVEAFFK